MVEGGDTPLATTEELGELGFKIVIFPGGIVRALARTAQAYYRSLFTNGSNEPFREHMFDFSALNGLIGTADLLAQGREYDASARPGRCAAHQGSRAMTAIDPVTLAVLKGRLEQIADEMDATLYRSAFNPIIAEARDACHGLYHAETGDTLVQGTKGCRSSWAPWPSRCGR